MRLVRVDGLAVIMMVSLFSTLACKPQSSASPRKPAANPSEEEEEQDPNPPAKTNTTASQPAPATATTPANTGVPPISITPGSGSGSAQPGGFIGNLISQFGGGGGFGGLAGGLGGLTSSLGGLLNGGGLGGFDFGSLLNGLGSGFGGLANGFSGQANASTPNNSSTSSAQIALVSNTGDLRVDCLNAINQYRASIGRPALTLKNDEATNSCIDKQSADDGAAGAAHRNFGKCGESAQNECPGWGGDPSTAQNGCLKMMWAEGPGGGHYENMANGAYKQVSCGYAQVGGKLWMIQNFYR